MVELQKQIIELIDQNSEAERRCRLLRQQLAREAEEIFVRSKSVRQRLRRAAGGWFKRLFMSLSRNSKSPGRGFPRPIAPGELTLLPQFIDSSVSRQSSTASDAPGSPS